MTSTDIRLKQELAQENKRLSEELQRVQVQLEYERESWRSCVTCGWSELAEDSRYCDLHTN
jgi:hypothetical protein